MRFGFIIILTFCAILSSAQSKSVLSENAEISVVTCGPGQQELYSAFGHSAFRVYDPVLEIDLIFNYGVFDFDQPNFYLNFARGFSYYKLGVMEYSRFREIYVYYNRSIREQKLNLTTPQKDKLFAYLEWNALPENASYLYDYFYDNCATKIRDVFVEAFGEEVVLDNSHITTDYSIRELTDLYLEHQPWGDLAIDLCLGSPIDKKAKPNEYVFLPDYVEKAFDQGSIKHGENEVPLVEEKIIVYEAFPQEVSHTFPHPWYVFGAALIIVLSFSIRDWMKRKLSNWLDVTLLITSGLIGLLLLFLWLATNHKAAAMNFNLLWALPTNLVLAWMLITKRNKRWINSYFLICAILTFFLLASWFFLPQLMHPFLIPIVVALGIRYALNYQLRKTTTYESVGLQ